MTRDQIANRIREEHRKHPELDWPDIAAAKIISSMREEAQPSAPTVEQIMEVVVNALADNDAVEWKSPPVSYNAERDKLLRARLTKLLTNP